MIEYIRDNDHNLEEKIKERTAYLIQSEEKFRALFDTTRDAVMLLDENGFFECNQATLDIFECPTFETFYALHPSDLSPIHQPNGNDSLVEANQHIQKAFINGREQFEWVHKKYNKEENFYAEVTLNAIVIDGKEVLQAMVRDINQKKLDEEEIYKLAFYDPLTLLPNRRLLNERVQHTIQLSKRGDDTFALMFLDLDNFKPLNDKFGHDVGDLLLLEVSNRLTSCVRESDTVARFGGDEFVILLERLGKDENNAISCAKDIAQKVLQSIEEEYILSNQIQTFTHHCSVSIGIEIFSGNAISKDDIFKHADEAMYKAKEQGKGQVVFYSELQKCQK
jgi:diguanylate cyclase (GGDEF)-like protein